MEGQSGTEGGRGSWRDRTYDATDQIKQLLRIPPDHLTQPSSNGKPCTPSQGVPTHKQVVNRGESMCGESPGSRHQRWPSTRYNDGRHNSPGRGGSRQFTDTARGHYDMTRNQYDMAKTPPQRYIPSGSRRNDGYGSPGRGANSQGYEQKDLRHTGSNGPRLPVSCMNNSNNNSALADSEPPDFLPCPEVLAELEQQFLFPLKKKSLKFPKAKYFCRLCDYHCDSLAVCRRHVMDSRHNRLKEAKDLETTLKNVPPPVDAQIVAIESLVKAVAAEWRVDEAHACQRQEVAARLSDLLNAEVKGCSLEVVGSTLSGFCLKSSDLNLDIVTPADLTPSTPLLAVRDLVKQYQEYRDVKDDLCSSFPTISFTHCGTGVRVVVGVGGSASRQTNQLLADYATLDPRVTILALAFRRWAQLSQIDDQARGTLPPHVFPLMLVHFLQQHQPPVLPCLHALHPTPSQDSYLSPKELDNKWQCQNSESIGQLWIQLFRFYTVGFRTSDFVINVRQLHPITKVEKTWSKKIAVEDPFLQKRNLTRTVSGNQVFEYIADRLKMTYRYFSVPQLHYGPLFLHIVIKEDRSSAGRDGKGGTKNKKADMLLESIEKKSVEDTSNYNGMEFKDDEGEHEGTGAGLINFEDVSEPLPSVTPTQAAHLMAQLLSHHINYKFLGEVFTCGHPPPLICGSCQKEGHCKADCHEDDLPPLKSLPPINNYFLSQLSSIILKLQKDFEPTNEEIEERDRVVADLESYIRQFFQSVRLQLFGSSANGFGFMRSDLDICLTFQGNPTGVSIDHIKIIESLAEKLKRYRQCGHVFAITTAKVPIVKFSIRRPILEGDLSLYNTLALQNTKLLLTYANIDHRVKCLGYAMKHFAKKCDIGDASRGSLSSYAYILMVLHYLQQCQPPVIPVLQELYDHSKPAPQLMIDGWNAWFYNDLDNLKTVWKDYGCNKESVGQLWVGLLCYYTETFNWREHVVTIRQAAPLTRLQKLWNSRCIVIEDPFDLSHNLGAGLSRKMNTFIMKAFIRGREVLELLFQIVHQEYLFDRKLLTDGAPPNDRGCRFCGKIGHIQKDCPKKRANIEKRDKKERQKDRRELRKLVTEVPEAAAPQSGQQRQEEGSKETRPSQPLPSSGTAATASLPLKTSPAGVAPGPSSAPVVSSVANAVHTDGPKPARQNNNKTLHSAIVTKPTGDAGVGCQSAIKEQRDASTTTVVTSARPTEMGLSATYRVKLGVQKSGSGGESDNCETCNSQQVSKSCPEPPAASVSVVTAPGVARLGGTTVVQAWGHSENVIQSQCGGLVSVPPGFQAITHHTKHELSSQATSPDLSHTTQPHTPTTQLTQVQSPPSVISTQLSSTQVQHKKQVQQQLQVKVSQQHQQGGIQQWRFWPTAALPQPLHLPPKMQKEESEKCKPYDGSSPACSSGNQAAHQQQYPYSISPAALFHMASQAAGGQVSAVMVPGSSQAGVAGSRSGLLGSSGPSEDTSNTSTPAHPPPGFSAPVAISYHSHTHTGDPIPVNKLVMGSPLYRSSVSQSDGQTGENSSTQSFLTVSQAGSGPLAGIYLHQVGGGTPYPSLALTSHTIPDTTLTYHTRHYLTQQMAQGPHQAPHRAMAQGPHQAMAQQAVTPGPHQAMPQGSHQAVAQGPHQTVAQGLHQGMTQGVASTVPPGVPQGGAGVPLPPSGLPVSLSQGLSPSVSQVNLGTALSQGIAGMTLGHPLQQHTFPQPGFPQQGYQMAVGGGSGYYPEFVVSDPGLQNPSASTQQGQPASLPAEMMTDVAFQRAEVYDNGSALQPFPQFLSSTLPQHQNLLSQPHPSLSHPLPSLAQPHSTLSQPHPNMAQSHPSLPQPHPGLALPPHHNNGPAPPYTPASLLYIEGERDTSQVIR